MARAVDEMMPFSRPFASLVVCAAATLSAPASRGGAAEVGQFMIYEENDTFGFGDSSDRHYTQGLRIEYLWKPGANSPFAKKVQALPMYFYYRTDVTTALGLAQNMYTPEVIVSPVYNPSDRPFAGWLYLAMKTIVTDATASGSAEWQDMYEWDLGTVGPRAQADEVQSWFHEHVVKDPDDPTYVNQIPDQWVIMAAVSRHWLYSVPGIRDNETWRGYVLPSASVRLGNVLTEAGMGMAALWGKHTPRDFSAGLLNPSFAGDADDDTTRVYIHAGPEARVQAFNAFLDGTWHEDGSPSIPRNPLVFDLKVGGTISRKWFRLSYTRVWRSPEIRSRKNFQSFGAIQLGIGNP